MVQFAKETDEKLRRLNELAARHRGETIAEIQEFAKLRAEVADEFRDLLALLSEAGIVTVTIAKEEHLRPGFSDAEFSISEVRDGDGIRLLASRCIAFNTGAEAEKAEQKAQGFCVKWLDAYERTQCVWCGRADSFHPGHHVFLDGYPLMVCAQCEHLVDHNLKRLIDLGRAVAGYVEHFSFAVFRSQSGKDEPPLSAP